jgi:hypothetical protein
LRDRSIVAVNHATYSTFLARLDAEPNPNDCLQETARRQTFPLLGPELLTNRDVSTFSCGSKSLDDWLKRQLPVQPVTRQPNGFVAAHHLTPNRLANKSG